MYTEFLSQVRDKLAFSPLSITSEFERSFLNASKKIFSQTNLYGCYFHFKQSMWRKIVEIGLKDAFNDDDDVRLMLKFPQTLAFIEPIHVVEAFNKIKTKVTDEKVLEFYKYIEDYYVGKMIETKTGRGRGIKLVKSYKEPVFEINLWNVHSRINDCLPRTNNFVESWHNAFSVSLYKFSTTTTTTKTFF